MPRRREKRQTRSRNGRSGARLAQGRCGGYGAALRVGCKHPVLTKGKSLSEDRLVCQELRLESCVTDHPESALAGGYTKRADSSSAETACRHRVTRGRSVGRTTASPRSLAARSGVARPCQSIPPSPLRSGSGGASARIRLSPGQMAGLQRRGARGIGVFGGDQVAAQAGPDVGGAEAAVQHPVDLGHRRIARIDRVKSPSALRRRGCDDLLTRGGLTDYLDVAR